jgi:hypothetical protein
MLARPLLSLAPTEFVPGWAVNKATAMAPKALNCVNKSPANPASHATGPETSRVTKMLPKEKQGQRQARGTQGVTMFHHFFQHLG